MSLIEHGELLQGSPGLILPERERRLVIAQDIADHRLALSVLFPDEEILATTKRILDETGFEEKAQGRKWALLVTNGESPDSDIAESVLTDVFSGERFGEHPADIARAYGHYKPASLFISVVDTEHPDGPRPVSALQAVKNSVLGCKSINTLADPDPTHNPWYRDLSQVLGEWTEDDVPRIRETIRGLYDVDPSETWSIESMAALPEYAGNHGLFGDASFPLYAICLQMSDRAGVKSWLSIQDIKPMLQMQRMFAEPWSMLQLPPREYDGSLTIPTVIHDMPKAEANLRAFDTGTAELMIDGKGMSDKYVTPDELFSEDHLNTLARNLT